MLQVASRIKIIFAAVLLLLATGAMADLGTWAENQNEYMLIQMGQSLHADVGGVHVDRPGRWGVFTIKGDPESDLDDGLPIIRHADSDFGPGGRLGYTTINVDGTSAIFGDQKDGSWALAPYESDSSIGNYVGLTGFYVNSRYRVSKGNIYVQFRLVVIRDQVRFEVFLRNDDSAPHNVGLRHCADSTTDGMIDSLSYPFIPGRGIVMSETSLTGTDIPDYFELYDNAENPTVAMRNSLRFEDCTPPDRVAVGSWQNLASADWNYTPLLDQVVNDYGWAIWWNPVALNPGESRTIITYFGMAAASSSWTSTSGTSGSIIQQDPFCVAVQGPRALPINYDPIKPPSGMLEGNPFKIKAYVYNLYRDTTLTNVNVHLTLPPGLELVAGDAMQEITSISPESEAVPIVWSVKSNGQVTGELKYWVSVSGTPMLQKTVTRTIMVPATSATPIKQGWQLVSVPFKFTDPRIENALTLTADSYRTFYWDTQTSDYRPVTTIAPGQGFWINSSIDRTTATVARDARPLSGADSYRIVLYTGWNQFGNPYLYCIPWGRIKVLASAQDGPITVEEAAARNIIRRTIYWYDADMGEYQYSSNSLTNLVPWQGYWIKALQPCQLIIPPIEQADGGISGSTTRSRAVDSNSATASGGEGWKLKLVARAGKAVDSRSVIGVDTRASDAYDAADVERPPSPGDYVSISFPHKDWGVNNGSYLADVRRSAGGPVTWDMTVSTDKVDTDVVLTWPTMMDVPKDYSLKLVDVDGNTTKYMRTTSSYRFNSGKGGARRFRLVAEPGKAGRLLVTGLAVSTSRAIGGATISYNLSTDATADVKIKSAGGRVVRTVVRGRGVTRGITNLAWNYRDEAGASVPAGSYLVEVVATTPDGEVSKAIRPFLVAR